MTTRKTLAAELLKQDGSVTGQALEQETAAILHGIKKYERRLRLEKRINLILWLVPLSSVLALIAIILLPLSEGMKSGLGALAGICGYFSLIFAIISSVLIYFRSRSLTSRRILASLVRIEEAIQQLSKKEESGLPKS